MKRKRDSSMDSLGESLEKKQNFVICDPKTSSKSTKLVRKQIRPWANLPWDLLREIMSRLCLADRIRFSLVCRGFNSLLSPCRETQASDNLPWLINYDMERWSTRGHVMCVFRLFDPVHQRLYGVHGVKPTSGTDSRFLRRKVQVLCAKKGWVFCSKYKAGAIKTSYWLFSPFTRQIIEFPELDHSSYSKSNCEFLAAAMSSDPLFPDCVYFVLLTFTNINLVVISTIQKGDKEWNTLEFAQGSDFGTYINGVVYHKGCFYCIFRNGKLRGYDVVRRHWSDFTGLVPTVGSFAHFYILVCAGKLLIAEVKARNKEKNQCCVFGFNKKRQNWVAKTSVGDHAIFLGRSSFSISTMTGSRDMANRVYYYLPDFRGSTKYFTLQDGGLHEFRDGSWPTSVAGNLWIEPPTFVKQHSQEPSQVP